MNLLDKQINLIKELLPTNYVSNSFDKTNLRKILPDYEMLFPSDSTCELGGNNLPCVGICAVTSSINLDNKTIIIGDDLPKIKNDSPFAKIVLLQIDDDYGDEQSTYNSLKELEFVKYNYFIDGFMIRASGLDTREQVRIGKKAIKEGLTFSQVGNTLINKYLEYKNVKAATIIFITEKDFNYLELGNIADKVKDIVGALNHIFDNVVMNCNACNLKPICDEVEGMKELHMKQIKK